MKKVSTVPKVAVITRTKDRPLLLERAIKSIHNQTFRDYIHIIINDGGDSIALEKLLKKYTKQTSGRIKVIHNEKSNGMEAASNKAIKSIDSVYVAIHDDDDSWHPAFLEKTVEFLEETQEMGVVVTTDRIIEKIHQDTNDIETIQIDRWLPDLKEINLYEQLLDNYATPITFIYRRQVYDNVGYYDETLQVAGDWDFAIRFLCEYDIAYLKTDYALAYYHHRPDAIGVNGNTVFSGADRHTYFINIILNKYLRQDLKRGSLGIGYIMNDLRYGQRLTNESRSYLDKNVVRLEGHVNYSLDHQRQYLDRRFDVIKQKSFGEFIVRLRDKFKPWN